MRFQIILGRIGHDLWANTRLKIIKKSIKCVNKNILDLGCGSGYIGRIFHKNNNVIFADIDKEKLEKIKIKNAKKIILDATKKLSFKDNFFDLVICADVLEHIKDDKKVLKNIYRVLKPKGKTVIAVPAHKALYGHHDIYMKHYRRYNKKEFEDLVKKLGYKVIKSQYYGSTMLLPFLINQKFTKKEHFYEGKSKLEPKIVSLLNIISEIDSKINCPAGIGLLFILEK